PSGPPAPHIRQGPQPQCGLRRFAPMAYRQKDAPSLRMRLITSTECIAMGQRRSIAGSRMLITGASQGIGRTLAVAAARRGAKGLAAARNEAYLQELAKEVRAAGGTLEIVVTDVTHPADRQKMVDAAQRYFGGLDILVNNAGIGATGHFADVDFDILRKI